MKRDIYFSHPLTNAAGTLGFDPLVALRTLKTRQVWDQLSLGAFVTNPISFRPRLPASPPAMREYPGGFLLHTGLPNPGLPAVLKKYARHWASAPLPVIVHLMADRPEETARMVRMLENVENVMAVEFGFAPGLSDDILSYAVEMSQGELPIIVSLPWDQVLRLAPGLLALGAQAVSLAAPRGLLFSDDGKQLTGRLFGPALWPQAMLLVRDAVRAGIPLIGGCGVFAPEQAQAMLNAGAMAVQLDALLWRAGATPG